MTYAIPQALILAMVDMVVMDVMPIGGAQVHARVGETGYLTVIHFKTLMRGPYAVGGGEFVVVLVSPAAGAERAAMMVKVSLGIRPADTQAGDAYVRPVREDHNLRHQRIAGEHRTFRAAKSAITG